MLAAPVPPVTPFVVVAAYAPAPARWLPAHRGVDLRARPGQVVHSPAACRLAFAGRVAGRPVVSLSCPAVRFTFEPVRTGLAEGTRLQPGQRIGRVGRGGHCDASCVHWGAKRDGVYVDPLAYLVVRAPVLKPVRP